MDTGDFLGGELLLGIAISLVNIAVHAMVMALISRATHRTSLAVEAARAWLRLVLVMWSAVSILMLAHLVEVAIWAATYRMLDLTPQPFNSFYFAFVNYTTLGYGDILPAQRWRLLGPITAMNGVLLFGWSAAVIYDILRTIAGITLERGREARRGRRARPAFFRFDQCKSSTTSTARSFADFMIACGDIRTLAEATPALLVLVPRMTNSAQRADAAPTTAETTATPISLCM